MTAITADTLTLARLTPAPPDAVERPVARVTTGPTGLEGLGFPVRRTLAGLPYALTDPFIMMDHMGEVEYEVGEAKGTDWHPHRGFETVTYLIDGQFLHQDSHGGGGVIAPGDTQWMTAASGILHIETPPASLVETGGLFNGFQIWVNLPAKDKMLPPAYQPVTGADLLLLTDGDAGSIIRVIAGNVDGHVGPGSTHTPISLVHASIPAGQRVSIPWQPSYNALAYVFAGSGRAGVEEAPVAAGNLVAFGAGDRVTLTADPHQDSRTEHLEVLVLGGEPINEPMEHYGPFVMNTRAELAEAVDAYQRGELGAVPPDALMPHVSTARR
ncbi:MAG: pirin family protein [Actinobacteria bacterium]|nr:pirin family protein [Actinomycetota bacterium]